MPSTEQIKKAQDRRAAREGKKAANVEAAANQEHELAAISDRLRGVAKPDPDAQFNEAGLRVDQIGMADPAEGADEDGFHRAAAKPAVKGTRAQQKAAQQAAAAAQAEADVQATVNPLPERDEHDLGYYRAHNIEPPLHVLNAIARRADNAIKDDARVAAQAAGKAAYEALTEHKQRGPEARHKGIEKALREAAASKSQVGAADPVKE
jgi:hypothetical protein